MLTVPDPVTEPLVIETVPALASIVSVSSAPREIEPDSFYNLKLDEEQAVFANAIWNPNIDIVFCN